MHSHKPSVVIGMVAVCVGILVGARYGESFGMASFLGVALGMEFARHLLVKLGEHRGRSTPSPDEASGDTRPGDRPEPATRNRSQRQAP